MQAAVCWRLLGKEPESPATPTIPGVLLDPPVPRAQEGARVTELWGGSDVASATALTDAPTQQTAPLNQAS